MSASSLLLASSWKEVLSFSLQACHGIVHNYTDQIPFLITSGGTGLYSEGLGKMMASSRSHSEFKANLDNLVKTFLKIKCKRRAGETARDGTHA